MKKTKWFKFLVFNLTILCLMFCLIDRINAKSVLPPGGTDFDTAVSIQQGSYQGQISPKSDFYYQIKVKSGQAIKISGGFVLEDGSSWYYLGDVYFYDHNREEQYNIWGEQGDMPAWLNKSDQIMYIRIENDDDEKTLYYNLEIVLTKITSNSK